MFWLNQWPDDTIASIRAVFRIWSPLTQAAVACLFLVYAMRFNMRKKDYDISKASHQALAKLAQLCIAGFITFLIYAFTNVLGGQPEMVGNVGVVTFVYIAMAVANTIRAAAVLLVLNVRLEYASDRDSVYWTSPLSSRLWNNSFWRRWVGHRDGQLSSQQSRSKSAIDSEWTTDINMAADDELHPAAAAAGTGRGVGGGGGGHRREGHLGLAPSLPSIGDFTSNNSNDDVGGDESYHGPYLQRPSPARFTDTTDGGFES